MRVAERDSRDAIDGSVQRQSQVSSDAIRSSEVRQQLSPIREERLLDIDDQPSVPPYANSLTASISSPEEVVTPAQSFVLKNNLVR